MNTVGYSIQTDRRLIRVWCTGTISISEILEYERRVVDDPDFDSEFSELVDLSGTAVLEGSFEDVDNLVEFERSHARYIGRRKSAIVAPSDLNYGTIKMYISINEDSPMETRVLREMDSAVDWPGLTKAP